MGSDTTGDARRSGAGIRRKARAALRGRRGEELRRRATSALMALVLLASTALSALSSLATTTAYAAASGDTAVVENAGSFFLYGDSTGVYTRKRTSTLDGQTNLAFCVNPSLDGRVTGTFTITDICEVCTDAEAFRTFTWFGYGGPGFDASMWPETYYDGSAWTEEKYISVTHFLLAYTYTGDFEEATSGCYQEFKDWVADTILGYGNSGYGDGSVHSDSLANAMLARADEVPDSDSFFVYRINSGNSTTQYFTSFWYVPTGTIRISKSSSNVEVSGDVDCYDLAGATYGVYSDAACTDLVATLEIGDDGTAAAEDIAAGTYYVRETSQATGYDLDETVYTLEVEAGETAELEVTDSPQNDPLTMCVRKLDAETGGTTALGAASLEGAEFTVTYYGGYFDTAEEAQAAASAGEVTTRTWVLRTDEDGYTSVASAALYPDTYLVGGDDFYYSTSGAVTIPLGTVTVQETAAPEGYLLSDDAVHLQQVTPEGTLETVSCLVEQVVPDQVRRGDLEFTKADDASGARLANVAFLVTSETTGESHVIVTDENGYFCSSSSWNAHTSNTNANDAAYDAETGAVDSSLLDPEAGLWFSGLADGETEPDDSLGALPYDTYTVQELSCDANEGKSLASFEVHVTRDGVTYDMGTVDDHDLGIATELVASDTGEKAVPADSTVSLTDTVAYEGLESGAEYVLESQIHLVSADGEDQGVVATAETTFSAKLSTGSVDVQVAGVDTTGLGGCSLVCFEYLYRDGELVASHEDLGDEDQTVTVPEVGTTLSGDLDQEADATAETITLVDTVSYSGVTPGVAWTVTGTLHLREVAEDGTVSDGGVVTDADGNPITATASFTPTEASGTAEVTFTFDADDVDLSGQTVVAFEELSRNGVAYAAHADIEDGGQTVTFPGVETDAVAADTGDHLTGAWESQTIVDTVSLSNLVVGREYVVTGTLHVQEVAEDGSVTDGGEVLDSDGNPVTATTTVTADATDMEVELTFEGVDLTAYAGRTVVAFEDLSRDGVTLGTHADIEDEGQSVHVPAISTELLADNGAHEAQATDNGDGTWTITLVDTVSYENLVPGREYALEAELRTVGADGGEAVDDTEVESAIDATEADGDATEEVADDADDAVVATASVAFTPDEASGTAEVELTATVDAAACSLVCFERLYTAGADGEDVLVAEHADEGDEGQTVSLVDIGTTAADAGDGDKLLDDSSTVGIVDTVSYEGLTPGEEYVVVGTLHVQATDGEGNVTDGGEVLDSDGNAVSATATFTPEESNGTVEVTFELDTTGLDGQTLVCFESLYDADGIVIAQHADIGDEGQSVEVDVPEEGTTTTSTIAATSYPQTGQGPLAIVLVTCGAAAIVASVVVRRRLARAAKAE